MSSKPSLIQTWPVTEAPERLRRRMPDWERYDWLALIPPELNIPEMLNFILSKTAGMVGTYELKDESLLLAGTYREPKAQWQTSAPVLRSVRGRP